MRRTTSALITMILGAIFTASMVSAQQSPPSGSAPRGGSTPPASTTAADSATAAAPAPLYGMTATRGVRYLLRNGLDYLNYQQYDRALKFLREAETHLKELNDTEKLALKQGIERAQRGLREASDAESPYALSERSRHRAGFTPAKPQTKVAASTDPVNPPARQAKTNRSAPTNLLASDGEDQGEPIRLASGEAASSDTAPPQSNASPRSTNTTTMGPRSNQPASLPAVPNLPSASQLLDPTGVSAMPNQRGAAVDQGGAGAEPVATQENGTPRRPSVVAETSQALVSTPAAGPTLEPRDVQTPDKELVLSPVPTGDALAPNMTATIPAPVPLATPAPSSSGLAQPTAASLTPEAAPKPTVIELETVSSPALSSGTAQSTAADGLPHKESEDATPASMPNPRPDSAPAPITIPTPGPADAVDATPALMPNPRPDSAPAPTAVPAPGPAAPVAADATPASMPNPAPDASPLPTARLTPAPAAPDAANELPPLPSELGRTSTPNPAQDALPPPAAALTPAPAIPDAANELPPLPPDLGRTSTPNPTHDAPPTPTAAPTPESASPEATDPRRSPAATPHSEEESLPRLPGQNEAASTTTAAPGEGRNVDAGPAVVQLESPRPAVSDTSGPGLTGGPDPGSPPADVNPPVLPAPGLAVAAPAAQPSPPTDPNPDRQGVATTATGVEAAPDPTSLPPAIKDRAPIPSSLDAFMASRHISRSTLRPELRREVEIIARNQDDELRRQLQNPAQPADAPRDTTASDLRTQTQLDISRAPSPAEARPIRAIPVPEDWVALPPRTWAPQRKYWAAAATCHLPLYFQDPVLERYGHSVENFVGPMGRFLTYPVDDPTQSTQRNQILQPFFSVGLFALQIAAWPYNLIMDPPWEAQYDLGYYRPGDNIPTDTYWLPLHGYGPPLRGSNY